MTKTVLSLTLTVLAFILMLAGSVNLRSANANAGVCDGTCACYPVGGDLVCCTQGSLTCYTRETSGGGGDLPIEPPGGN
jgi:hypothetical protein